ncbi:sulfotransferase family protein [Actinomadura sp. NTSP31]|uniref:sulfotransferase-like domain-containing protein n=1 Tax=Actinomadura sp. NTSP31 TaxID=1735447 RepID=UPI0035C1FC8E
MSDTGPLFLWSAPRSLSSAFCRMMIERGDFTVFHEPFSSLVVLGYVMIDGRKVSTTDDLAAELEALSRRGPVFVKETTEYRYDAVDHPTLLATGTHTFLIRSLGDSIASHYAMNPEVRCEEIGMRHLFEIFERVEQARGRPPVLIEAEDLVRDPGEAVRRYCKATGIPFLPEALTWQPGDREEWSRTRRWQQAVARTSGFERQESRHAVTVDNNAMLAGFYAEELPYYERLRSHSITRVARPESGVAR